MICPTCRPFLRRPAALAAILATAALAAWAATTRAGDPAPDAAPDARPFAVVELFTSEGCSSCPPADAALADLAADARATGRRVFALAWHVDYWDRLGWADPYASAAATRRQNDYARAFASRNVYTPQAVVNGRAEFVGSDRARTAREVDAALAAAPAVAATVSAADRGKGRVGVTYALSAAPAGSTLVVAAAERGLTSRVRRGENAGRTLRHENVVRAFASIPLAGPADRAGTVDLALPDGVDAANVTVVALVQDDATMTITGASAADVAAR